MERWNNVTTYKRSKDMLLKEIKQLAESYTPEWKFSTHNPDAGSVIAMIFADQMRDNVKNINSLIEKYHTEFANMCGVVLNPAHPATSIAVFTPGETISTGSSVYKGTQLLGETTDEEEVVFETMHDIYVTGAKITDVAATYGDEIILYMGGFQTQDIITGELTPVFDQDAANEISLFSDKGKKIGRQALLIAHKFLFQNPSVGIRLRFWGNDDCEKIAATLCDPENYEFFIYSKQGLVPVDKVSACEDYVEIFSQAVCGDVERGGDIYQAIVLKRRKQMDIPLIIKKIEIITGSTREKPDFIYDGSKELETDMFLPFGQKPSLYDECYIGKKQWMNLSGFEVTIEFDLNFGEYEDKGIVIREEDLRIIKRKRPKDFEQRIEYICHVQEVSLEYFNGYGWKRLPCTPSVQTIFSDAGNAGHYRFSFEIPYDWDVTVQGGYEEKTLRLQIKRADNCYVAGAKYIYPVITGIMMQIENKQRCVLPDRVEFVDGVNRKNITGNFLREEPVRTFDSRKYRGNYMYLGFDRKFYGGPVSLFIEMDENFHAPMEQVDFSYSSTDGFKVLKVTDYTNHFQNSERIIFFPPPDQAVMEIEGEERYWLRIETQGRDKSDRQAEYPVIRNIFMNAAEIQNIETGIRQEFFIDTVEAGMSFSLNSQTILNVEVWVNEVDVLSRREMEILLQKLPGRVNAEYNFMGEIEEFFIKWDEVPNFDETGGRKRVYVIDRSNGRIYFGDGIHVSVPHNTKGVAFWVVITRCSGEKGNLKAGAINSFKGNLLPVESVFNPVAATGGCNIENIDHALERASNILSAGRRLVTEEDYLAETRIYLPETDQAACIIDRTVTGDYKEGSINLVLLLKNYQLGSHVFYNIREGLKRHMLEKCELTCREEDLNIVEPVFVKISVRIWIRVENIAESLDIKDRWLEAITDFLDPLSTSKRGGWKIGTLPTENQIKIMLNAQGIQSAMEKYSISASYQGADGIYEKALDSIEADPYMICLNGEHEVIIVE